jgi:hypothetical protein
MTETQYRYLNPVVALVRYPRHNFGELFRVFPNVLAWWRGGDWRMTIVPVKREER